MTISHTASPLLEVDHLHTHIPTPAGVVRAVDDVSLSLHPGEAMGIVGESGSGKSVLARSIMGLLPRNVVRSGAISFDGRDLLSDDRALHEELWGRRIALVFQDPSRSLNPVVRVERQLTEGMRKHLGISQAEARGRALQLLQEVGVPDPERRLTNFPGQMSGGMRQRVMIAVALSCEPDLLIADEPTTALDVTIQRQILDLLERLRQARRMSLLLISHDLGVVAGRTDRVAVMYAGRLVETGRTKAVFATPQHRYTEALLGATPSLTLPRHTRLQVIKGGLPNVYDPPAGCRFADRCVHVSGDCRSPDPFWIGLPGSDHMHGCRHPASGDVVSATAGGVGSLGR
ncbi:ABC transporter ATP-binding protein [Pseudonocardia oroxyli]|uniref:Peptide/nickel transport system ATP-binding protein n=1 Tax=Pseudonocardia oroxyli TaxID=366584 RepID=A0A1G8EPY5_PSEOR|nr:ABC transporter ATP-binding protein [Pseudonocardia oroxyli]SDH71912.1 peptide/nickel transport system ATP-binding protein [Pseudonocardia oroxyli]